MFLFWRLLKKYFDDFLVLVGAGLVVYGVGLVYVPAAWMVSGFFVMVAGLFIGFGSDRGGASE